MSVLTSMCSLRTCTVLPQIQLEQQRGAAGVCLRACGRRDGYVHNKKRVHRFVRLHLLHVSLYEPSMSKWGRVKPCKH